MPSIMMFRIYHTQVRPLDLKCSPSFPPEFPGVELLCLDFVDSFSPRGP